jgi:hypothetical protein
MDETQAKGETHSDGTKSAPKNNIEGENIMCK